MHIMNCFHSAGASVQIQRTGSSARGICEIGEIGGERAKLTKKTDVIIRVCVYFERIVPKREQNIGAPRRVSFLAYCGYI